LTTAGTPVGLVAAAEHYAADLAMSDDVVFVARRPPLADAVEDGDVNVFSDQSFCIDDTTIVQETPPEDIISVFVSPMPAIRGDVGQLNERSRQRDPSKRNRSRGPRGASPAGSLSASEKPPPLKKDSVSPDGTGKPKRKRNVLG